MSIGTERTLHLIPPHGPLCWVYPELAGLLSPRPDDDSRRTGKACQVIDLARSGLVGEPLLAAIDAHHPAEIRVEDGPRGHALWSWLRQALRGKDVRVMRPNSSTDLDPTGRRDIDSPSPSLEAFLASASGHLGADDYLVEVEASPRPRAQRKNIHLSPAPIPLPGLPEGSAESRRSLVLLPLTLDARLVRRLDAVLDTVSRDPARFREAGIGAFSITPAPALAPGAASGGTRSRRPRARAAPRTCRSSRGSPPDRWAPSSSVRSARSSRRSSRPT